MTIALGAHNDCYNATGASAYKGQGLSYAGLAHNATGVADGTDIGCNIANLPTS
jgi:hypothetical protein